MSTDMSTNSSTEWKHASWVSTLGKWAWILIILNAIIGLIVHIVAVITFVAAWNLVFPGTIAPVAFLDIWYIIGAIIAIIIGFFIIKPNFSNKCAKQDWDSLYDWSLTLGGIRLPWMLIWGIILEIVGWYGWGGLAVLVPAIVLIFAGPKKYEWSTQK